MAYIKHVWEQRLGTGLNKFKDMTTNQILELVNQPDSVTQAGTPLRADWLNDIEEGIRIAHETADAALPSVNYNPPDILTKLKTVDGAGSGLDADVLDGIEGSGYVKVGANNNLGDAATAKRLGSGFGVFRIENNADSGHSALIGFTGADTILRIRNYMSGGINLEPSSGTNVSVNGNLVWHEGNDGQGSNLDAGKLCGRTDLGFAYHVQLTNSGTPSGDLSGKVPQYYTYTGTVPYGSTGYPDNHGAIIGNSGDMAGPLNSQLFIGRGSQDIVAIRHSESGVWKPWKRLNDEKITIIPKGTSLPATTGYPEGAIFALI